MVHLKIPRQFYAEDLFPAVKQAFGTFDNVPEAVRLDFSDLRFVRPSGVVFLSNLTRLLVRQGCGVTYVGMDIGSEPIKFLDDSKFFVQHLGRPLREGCVPRSTTRPLIEIRHEQGPGWVSLDLIPWLSTCSGVALEQFGEFRTCILEVFNNIQDHTAFDVGSVFAQWYPNEQRLQIAIADFGAGIPATVRRREPSLNDDEAIVRAFEDGFSGKSRPQNQGIGLHYLKQNVTENLGGRFTVRSLGGAIMFDKDGFSVLPVPYPAGGFCPGTLIDIEIRTDLISFDECVDGEFRWT